MCHFPFKYLNTTYSSCAHISIDDFNMNGEPWCATEVEADGITVKEHKWSLCQDERGLIVDGEGNKKEKNNILVRNEVSKHCFEKNVREHFMVDYNAKFLNITTIFTFISLIHFFICIQ